MKKILLPALVVFCFSVMSYAQPRPVDRTGTPPPANQAYPARYEGGTFGASRKEDGTLKFDDANLRVVFYRKDGTEMFAIPYESLLSLYPDSKTGVSTTGNVVSRLPLPGAGMGGLLTSTAKYAIISFDDPDIDVRGAANFKFGERAVLMSFIHGLGSKAKMTQRGDAYYRGMDKPIY